MLLSAGAALVLAATEFPAAADDPWNPFADRPARTTRPAPPPATATRADPRPYLAPMSRGDLPRTMQRPRLDGTDLPPGHNAPSYPVAPHGNAANAGPPADIDPFDSRPGTYAPPLSGDGFANGVAAEPVVERGDLTPVIGAGPALAGDLWAGLDANGAEQLLAPAALPSASPSLARLVTRLLAQPVADPRLEMVRIASLLRIGAAAAQPPSANLASAAAGDGPEAAVALVLQARADLAAGRRDSACTAIKHAVSPGKDLPVALKGEAIVIAGYCAIASGNREAGPLAATLARDAGYARPFTLGLLEAVGNGRAPSVPLTGNAALIDGLLATELSPPDQTLFAQLVANADPALLAFLANLGSLPAPARAAAAEAAAARNVITPEALAEAWRIAATADVPGVDTPTLMRARLFAEAESVRAQFQKTRAIRALLDSARRDRLGYAAAAALAPTTAALRPAQEISWFAETAVEILAAGGDHASARQWIAFAERLEPGAGGIAHWLLLLDVADSTLAPNRRGEGFRAAEDAAARGRLAPEALHRLATVLDALDYNVPIPLWNLASRTPQPQAGFLPETGLLTALKRASEQRQEAATGLFALRTIAPEGAGATHLLGLGEAIRALKRAGLEEDARGLGFEALLADWPRNLGG